MSLARLIAAFRANPNRKTAGAAVTYAYHHPMSVCLLTHGEADALTRAEDFLANSYELLVIAAR